MAEGAEGRASNMQKRELSAATVAGDGFASGFDGLQASDLQSGKGLN